MELTAVELFPGDLTHEVLRHEFEEDGLYCDIAVVRFRGTYGHGSLGNRDAAYMLSVTAATVARLLPDVVLLDLTELDYRWGNSIYGVLQHVGEADAEHPIAVMIATSPRCATGLRSLLGPDVLADGLERALEKARPLALARARAIG